MTRVAIEFTIREEAAWANREAHPWMMPINHPAYSHLIAQLQEPIFQQRLLCDRAWMAQQRQQLINPGSP